MASLHLEPPASFPFSHPDEWPKWKQQFEQFRLALGVSTERDIRLISALLYCMGDKAEDIFASTNISEDDRKEYSKIITQFDMFFKEGKILSLREPALAAAVREKVSQWNNSSLVCTVWLNTVSTGR